MREIKFKFYDREEKRLIAISDVFDTALYPYLARTTLIPCQFTGLHSKSGQPIYEGDVYKIGKVVGVIEYSEKEARFELKDKGFAMGLLGGGDGEVIGNIYENPELLGEQFEKKRPHPTIPQAWDGSVHLSPSGPISPSGL